MRAPLRIRFMALALALAAAGSVFAANIWEKLVPVEGPAPDLFLLYTGDVIGYIEPCG